MSLAGKGYDVDCPRDERSMWDALETGNYDLVIPDPIWPDERGDRPG
jgi:DNA-binding response OmpR family regulator